MQLPTLSELPAVLNRPLAETEKIAISRETYADLISPLYELSDICGEKDISILFKQTDFDVISPLIGLYAAVVTSPGTTGTEQYFRGFWDNNIKDVIQLILYQGQSFRGNNLNTQTKNMRPDYGLLVQNVCVFRGKEKGPQNREDPRTELVDKLMWVYKPAEYILGEEDPG
jgi:hypothetical protein